MNANESLPTTADEIFATGTSIKLTDYSAKAVKGYCSLPDFK